MIILFIYNLKKKNEKHQRDEMELREDCGRRVWGDKKSAVKWHNEYQQEREREGSLKMKIIKGAYITKLIWKGVNPLKKSIIKKYNNQRNNEFRINSKSLFHSRWVASKGLHLSHMVSKHQRK